MPTQETPSTPGQIAYAAYTAALALTFPRPWDDVSPTMQAAWEAAAQAVAQQAVADTLEGQRLLAAAARHVPPPEERPMADTQTSPGRVHWARTIRGTQDTWLHCGRALTRVRWSRNPAHVTCRICRGYLARGEAAGYVSTNTEDIYAPHACPHPRPGQL